jgi:acetylornithine deacetylase/succinyl-diaminopimelate desuccinylase-like protein
MKNEVAARAVALASLAREGFRPRGDLVLLVAADEEDGSAMVGMNWLTAHRPDLAVDYALNEGGGSSYRLSDGRLVAEVGVGEKGTCPVEVEVLGEAGHASMPTLGRNPVPRLGEVLRRIGLGEPRPVDDPTLRAALDTLLGPGAVDELGLAEAVSRAAALHPLLTHRLPALTGTTMAPTLLRGSTASNVIPARVAVGLDCRVLPGTSDDQVLAEVRARIGPDDDLRLSQPFASVAGNGSPPSGPLWEACARFVSEVMAAEPLALLCTGFTDSVHLRRDFGTVAYGFSPFLTTPATVIEAGYHNRDERVHVDDLALSVDFHRSVARQLLGPAGPVPAGPGA